MPQTCIHPPHTPPLTWPCPPLRSLQDVAEGKASTEEPAPADLPAPSQSTPTAPSPEDTTPGDQQPALPLDDKARKAAEKKARKEARRAERAANPPTAPASLYDQPNVIAAFAVSPAPLCCLR